MTVPYDLNPQGKEFHLPRHKITNFIQGAKDHLHVLKPRCIACARVYVCVCVCECVRAWLLGMGADIKRLSIVFLI